MQITKPKIQYLFTLIFILIVILAWVLMCRDMATAGSYTDSAHGNSSYGVNRLDTGYNVGDCANCHDLNGPDVCVNELMLFYGWGDKCDLFCYKCHDSAGGEMQVDNYLYSMSFGGYTPLTWPGIYKQFCADQVFYTNCGSRHDLEQIYNLIKDDPLGWGRPPVPNPCWACHNTHLAKRIGSTQYHPPYDPTKSTISRPSDHNNLWGDDASERMDQYVASVGGYYQAPYYGSGPWDPITGPFEPAGDSTFDGSNLPDYVTFCMDCHRYPLYDPERSVDVKVIDWSSSGDKHGGRASSDFYCPGGMGTGLWEQGDLRAPYKDDWKEIQYNYVLSCTDCHEPHGSPNRLHLIRRFVNGENVAAETVTCNSDDDYLALCGRCHTNIHTSFGGCFVCHFHGSSMGSGCYPSERTF